MSSGPGGFSRMARLSSPRSLRRSARLQVDPVRGVVAADLWLPKNISAVFDFYSEPRNLERITPPFLKFRIEHISTPVVRDGTEIDYRLCLHGLPLRWRSRIMDWKRGAGFSDLQVKGPYRYWFHRHLFESKDGGTWIRDRVDFALPFGGIFSRAAASWIKKDLENIFNYRRDAVVQIIRGLDL